MWRAAPTIDYCRKIGISCWEGLWARFLGEDPNLKTLRAWASSYRNQTWLRALSDHSVTDFRLAKELAATFPGNRRLINELFPDMVPALTDLQENYRLAIVTNGTPDLQRRKIRKADLQRRAESIIITGEVGIEKPDPRIFALAVDQLGVDPAMVVMVGDSLNRDVFGAQQAGLKRIWLNRTGAVRDAGEVPDAQVASLLELREVVTRLDEGQSRPCLVPTARPAKRWRTALYTWTWPT